MIIKNNNFHTTMNMIAALRQSMIKFEEEVVEFGGLLGYAPIMHVNTFSRSEEHTSELQSRSNLVCRLLLEKKKNPKRQKPE